jgi:hypothetical protein
LPTVVLRVASIAFRKTIWLIKFGNGLSKLLEKH